MIKNNTVTIGLNEYKLCDDETDHDVTFIFNVEMNWAIGYLKWDAHNQWQAYAYDLQDGSPNLEKFLGYVYSLRDGLVYVIGGSAGLWK